MTHRIRLAVALVVGGILSASPFVGAAMQQAQPIPATGTSAQALEAEITGVEGLAEVRQGDDQPWVPAKVGMKVGEMAEFRTGPHSAIRFVIAPDQTITVDRLGIVKLLKAINDNGTIRTNVGMKYGRTRYDIEAAGRAHDASITTPNSTLAVRGTQFSATDQRPFPTEAVSLTGTVQYRDAKKQIAFGARGAGKTKVNSDTPNAAALGLTLATQDPSISLARSEAENNLVNNLLASGSTVFFDRDLGIKVVRGGTPPTDQQLVPALPGVLNIVARWHTNADLNLSVSTPGGPNGGGEVLYPIGALSTNSSGGKVAFDHQGGPNGGVEVVYFPTSKIPDGLYGIGLTLVSGATTNAQVDAFLNGRRVPIFTGQGFSNSVNVQVAPPIPGFVDGTAVGVLPVNVTIPSSRTNTGAASGSTVSSVKTSVPPKAAIASSPTVTRRTSR